MDFYLFLTIPTIFINFLSQQRVAIKDIEVQAYLLIHFQWRYTFL